MIARHLCIMAALLTAVAFGSTASGNVTVLVGDDSMVLIDAKFENEHDGIVTEMQ